MGRRPKLANRGERKGIGKKPRDQREGKHLKTKQKPYHIQVPIPPNARLGHKPVLLARNNSYK